MAGRPSVGWRHMYAARTPTISELVTGFESLLAQLGEDLRAQGAHWALIGGHSIAVRCEPRFTKDLDVAIAVTDDAEAEWIVRGLIRSGYHLRATVEQVATKRLATVRMTTQGNPHGPMVDLLFASSGIEPEVVSAAETVEVFPGITAQVAILPHLLALKILSRDDVNRPQDRLDLKMILTTASTNDIAQAREALGLIMQRGSNRGRDLPSALDAAIEEFGVSTQ